MKENEKAVGLIGLGYWGKNILRCLQGMGVLHNLFQIIVFGLQVFNYRRIFAVTHPKILILARLAVLGNRMGLLGCNRVSRHLALQRTFFSIILPPAGNCVCGFLRQV